MTTLVVPSLDEEPWPTLGPQLAEFLEERAVYGPGSLQGRPYELDPEFRAQLYRAYEVHPQGHEWAGRRRFKRVGISVRKGLAKTEKEALITYLELHPESPVRCDGFDARGNPVGRPVVAPYIPMLAVTVDQVEELAYGALLYIVENGPDADLFDIGLERIIRLDENGRPDGRAVPLANSPGSRDGARTTFQAFDEPHRLILPRQLKAHETMVANLEKRVLEDPWGLYVGTAGEPGEDSVAEGLHAEAQQIADGLIKDPQLFYFHRQAGDRNPRTGKAYDLTDLDERIEAVSEATGPIGEYGPGQFFSVAKQWDRPKADKNYLERVWLNRWTKSGKQAFDISAWNDLGTADLIPDGAFVTVGFDGARFRDSTGIVITDIATGVQRCWAVWERPLDVEEWEVPEAELQQSVDDLMATMTVWKGYADPPYWVEPVSRWSGKWPGQWEEWWTNRVKPMAYAVRDYTEAIRGGTVLHEVGRDRDPAAPDSRERAFARHVAAAGRKNVNLWDDQGERLFILEKLHPERKFDIGMAAVLSWRARLDAIAAGADRPEESFVPFRAR